MIGCPRHFTISCFCFLALKRLMNMTTSLSHSHSQVRVHIWRVHYPIMSPPNNDLIHLTISSSSSSERLCQANKLYKQVRTELAMVVLSSAEIIPCCYTYTLSCFKGQSSGCAWLHCSGVYPGFPGQCVSDSRGVMSKRNKQETRTWRMGDWQMESCCISFRFLNIIQFTSNLLLVECI